MKRTFTTIAVALALHAGAATAAWEGAVNPHGLRTAVAPGVVTYNGKEVPASLKLQCAPGSNGSVLWEMSIEQSATLSDFGFDDYEGPDAIANDRKNNTTLTPEGGMLKTVVKATPSGYYTEPDTFALSVSAKANESSDVALLAELVSPQTTEIVWDTRSLRGEGKSLVGRFPLDGATPVLRETMMGCGPAPTLDAKALDAALGRNPEASGLWRNRAIEWRLKGLLGADYEKFVTTMSNAQPLAKEGSVWYVNSAVTDDGNAAVLLFDDAATEVVFVEGGQVRRVQSSEGALGAPSAVRDFIANASAAE
jgi:hypothetical protein